MHPLPEQKSTILRVPSSRPDLAIRNCVERVPLSKSSARCAVYASVSILFVDVSLAWSVACVLY